MLIAKGDFSEAVEAADAGDREREPANASGVQHRGVALHEPEEGTRALADFTRATELTRRTTPTRGSTAPLAHARLGKPDLAAKDRARAIELDPTLAKPDARRRRCISRHRHNLNSAPKPPKRDRFTSLLRRCRLNARLR